MIDSFQKQHPGKQPGEFDSMVSPSYNSFIFNKSENWMQALSIIIIWVISCNGWHCTDSKMDVQLEITFALHNYTIKLQMLWVDHTIRGWRKRNSDFKLKDDNQDMLFVKFLVSIISIKDLLFSVMTCIPFIMNYFVTFLS